MKKSIIFVSLALCLALLQAQEAQEEQEAQEGASTQTASQKNEERVRLQSVVTASPMRSQLDELSRNVYAIDKGNIQNKGYRSTEDIFRYTPFVGLSNVGLGSNLDLRGQGNRANTSVQVLINGIYSNMLDSSHGVTPLNTLSPNAIESIEILPGGGAVMYGNGTRGGVVNIITQKRYEQPYFNAGVSYSHIIASTGDNYNADARFGTKLWQSTYLTIGAAYINRGGPRTGDKTTGAQANLALIHDFSPGHSLSLDVDYFTGKILTTPNNSFMDIANPSKDDRKTPGYGSLHNTQDRLDVSLGYEGQMSQNSKLELKAFYHLNRIKYVDSVTMLSRFNYGNFAFNDASADQSGSLFDDQKAGLIAKFDYKGEKNRLIIGAESIYHYGKRVMNQHLYGTSSGSMNGLTTGPSRPPQTPPNNTYSGNVVYDHTMNIPTIGAKWINSVYVLDKYDFSKRFSLTGGVRYELALYDIKNNYNTQGALFSTTGQELWMGGRFPSSALIGGSDGAAGRYTHTRHNYALELTPRFAYSDTGNVYLKYEKGYFSPSPNSMTQRSSLTYQPTNLKQEDYHTFEVGLKDFLGEHMFVSASAFYTLTLNEFYTIGNAHSVGGVQYGNYDFTQRAGIELFAEQYFLGDSLRFSESFTYIDAKILKLNGTSVSYQIPYVSNYKATIGVSYAFNRFLSIWSQNTFYGAQKDIMQEKNANHQDTIPAYSLTDIGLNLKLGDLSLSGGVRNVFDTFYYSYYNGNAADTIAGYGFLIGQGRSVFVEGRWSF